MGSIDQGKHQQKKPRRWRDKFREAGHGVWLAMQGQSSFAVHIFASVAVCGTAAILGCDRIEWCILIGCIGAVLTAEILNASIETLFHALDEDTKNRMTGCLDRAAGAVLLASITSAIIGCIILGQKFYDCIK